MRNSAVRNRRARRRAHWFSVDLLICAARAVTQGKSLPVFPGVATDLLTMASLTQGERLE